MEKYLDITKARFSEHICQSLGTPLYRGSTVPVLLAAVFLGTGNTFFQNRSRELFLQ